MRTKATATPKTMALWAAIVIVVLSTLPAFAAGGTDDCSPPVCTSAVVGPGHHQDVETR